MGAGHLFAISFPGRLGRNSNFNEVEVESMGLGILFTCYCGLKTKNSPVF
jgi:hypothetical protein